MKFGMVGKSLGFASVMAALFTSGCRERSEDAVWWRGERQRIELSHDLALKQYRYQQSDAGSVVELKKFRVSNEADRKRLLDLSHKQGDLATEVESMERQMAGVQEDLVRKQRQMVLGKNFKEFPVADGRTFKNATVVALDDAGVTIRHEDGSARLVYADLDDRQRIFFALDENASLAAQDEEKRKAAAYEQWIDSTVAANQAKDEQAASKTQHDEQRVRENRNLMAANQISASDTRALGQPARSFSAGYSGYSRPSYRYVYYYNRYNCNPYVSRSYRACYQPYQRISDTSAVNPTTTGRVKSFANTAIPYIP